MVPTIATPTPGANSNSSGDRTLNSKHYKHLTELRKIPAAWAIANCWSASIEQASELLGYQAHSSCIALQGDGTQIQVRPDKPWKSTEGEESKKKAPKYRSPLGDYDAMLPTYPEDKLFWRNWEALKQQCIDINGKLYIVITEGFFKAIVGCAHGIATIALLGVEMGLTSSKADPQGKRYLVAVLERLARAGFNFIIAFDADCATNEYVLKAEKKLTFQLKKMGVSVLSVTGAWTAGAEGETKGMDDFIKEKGIEEFRKILINAYERNWEESQEKEQPSTKSVLLERYEAAKAAFTGRLRYNELTMNPELDGAPLDFDTVQIKLARETGMDFPEGHVRSVILELASENSYDPVKDYLEVVCEQHGSQLSLENLAGQLLGTTNPLDNAYLKRHLIGSVARRYKPGCKMDTMLVLKGGQGIKKSTFFSTLYGDEFFDSTPADAAGSSKDELLRLHINWCNEWGELDGVMSKKDAARIKAELSNPRDTFRPPYGRNSRRFPRRFVNVGSTNRDSFLVDSTGDRRFWVIDLGSQLINIDKVRELRDQIWGAAVAAYRAGEQWWLTDEEQKLSNIANRAYAETDSWEDYILAFLRQELTKGVTYITVAQCLKDSLLGIEPSRQTKADQNRCADILRRSGWVKGEKKIAGQSRKVWLPPVAKKVSTPLGGDRGVETAEIDCQQATQPLEEKVSTPNQERFLENNFSEEDVEWDKKNIVQKEVTNPLDNAQNSPPTTDVAVSTPLVSTPPIEKSEDELLAGTLVESTSTHSDRKNLKGVQLTVVGISLRHPRCSAYDSISCQLPDGTTKDFARHSLKRV
jgi:predicted P-loop ATPase